MTTADDSGTGSLRDAIDMANSTMGADDIVFDASLDSTTINLTSGGFQIDEFVTIDASNLSSLVIDAAGLDATPGTADGMGDRIFDVRSGGSELMGLTLQNADVDGNGGAIRAVSSLTLTDSALLNNNATGDGGAIYASGTGQVAISSSDFQNNTAMRGGAVAAAKTGGFVTITDADISNNSASGNDANGGGVYLSLTTASGSITDSTINDNQSEGSGGGVFAGLDDTSLLIERSTIDANIASADGGGLGIRSTNDSTATIRNSTISANEADEGGGAHLYAGMFSDVLVNTSTVSGNSASSAGGGLSAFRMGASSVMRIDNSTVAENVAGAIGGGVDVPYGSFHTLVDNTIVAGNTGAGIPEDATGLIAANFSLFEATTSNSSLSGNGLVLNQNALIGPLADNGGPTLTHLPLAGSPALDAGSGTFSGFDQRGAPFSRVKDGDGNGTAVVDIGAVELQDPNTNAAPTADAGENVMTLVNTPVLLDGSGSTDPDQGPNALTYSWALIAGSGNVQFSAPTSATTEFSADQPGVYIVALTVDDGADQSTDTVNVTVASDNNAPTANVSLSENSGNTNAPIALDGTRSTDPDGDDLTYMWSIIDQPEESSPIIDDASAATTTLTTDVEGDYRVELVVSDGTLDSLPVTFVVSVVEINLPPVADVSLSQNSGAVFSLISLDGTRSSDPEGQPLSYQWTLLDQPQGAFGSLITPTQSVTTFLADTIGTYRVELVVNDGTQDSAPVRFTIDVAENMAPTANVSLSENSGAVAIPVVLDGSLSSDPEGENIGFTWSIIDQPDGSQFSIANPTQSMTTVVFDTPGQYRAELVVSDGFSSSDPVRFVITIGENLAPTANVSLSENSGVNGVPIMLDGTRSTDPEEQPLTYNWQVVDAPEGSVFDITTETNETDALPGLAQLTVDTPGQYRVELIVDDGFQSSAPVRFLVTVGDNLAPTANVSLSENSGVAFVPISLDGTRSSDPEGQPLTYQWTIVANSGAQILAPTDPQPQLLATEGGQYRVELVVSDGVNESAPVRFLVTVAPNEKPVADVSLSQNSGAVSVPVMLDGSRSFDPEGQGLMYSWDIIDVPDGANFQLTPVGSNAILVADTVGDYRAQLIVTDGIQGSDPVRFVIEIGPNLPPTADVSLSENSGQVELPIALDGTRSSDPEGQGLSYKWDVVDQPDGSNAEIADPSAAATTLIADTVGQYRVELMVSDGPNNSAPVRFLINVADASGNSRPIADVSLSENTGTVALFTQLDGTRSSDPDGDQLTYEWSVIAQPEGSQFGFINEFAAQTEITFDTAGIYRVQLVVNDGDLDSLPVVFAIDVAPQSALALFNSGAATNFATQEEAESQSALDEFFAQLGEE